MPSASGDPVLDCASRWREAFGTAAPPLVVYAGARGGILVLPASEPAPAGAVRLQRGFHQDAAVLQLSHELDDVARGVFPAGGCRSAAGARRLVDAQMARLGLTGWTVAFQGPRADGGSSCADYALGACQRRPTTSCGLRTLRPSSSSVAPIAPRSGLPASSRSSVLARLTPVDLVL